MGRLYRSVDMVDMRQSIGIFRGKRLNIHGIVMPVFRLLKKRYRKGNFHRSKNKPKVDFFESIISSQVSQICGEENCVSSYVCEPYIDDVRDEEIDEESERCG